MEERVTQWRWSVKRMSIDELLSILGRRDLYDSRIIKMVETRIKRMADPPKKDELDIRELEQEVRDNVIITLHRMGCTYKLDKGDIVFNYLGKEFNVDAGNEGVFIDVWNYAWMAIDLDDANSMSRLMRALNSANETGSVCTVYHTYKDIRKVAVTSGASFIFSPEILDQQEYFECMLERIIDTEHYLEKKMLELCEKDFCDPRWN